jgi:hypothetical protein
MISRSFIRSNIISLSIILFLIIFTLIHTVKPNFIYNKNGTFRDFGLGYRNKTILPMWLIVVVTAILCYLCILYFLAFPKILY